MGNVSSYQAALDSCDPSVPVGTSAILTEYINGNLTELPAEVGNVGVVNLVPAHEPAYLRLGDRRREPRLHADLPPPEVLILP